MKIISKRSRQTKAVEAIPGLEVTEVFSTGIIITGSGAVMSPDDIKRTEEIFRRIREELESIGRILGP